VKNPDLPAMTDYAMRLFWAYESAVVSHTIRRSFQHPKFTDEQVSGDTHILRFNHDKVRESAAFTEV
jgi:hypothetical protein